MARISAWVPMTAMLVALSLSACTDQADTDQQILTEIKALRAEVAALSAAVTKGSPTRRPTTPQPSGPITVKTAGFPVKGRADAPVTIVEFSDYQCPFCARHTKNTLPKITRNYIDSGQVRYIFIDNPIPSHRYAPKAAEAAHCAGDQGKYWEMHKKLFDAQRQIRPDRMLAFAEEVGVKGAPFAECMANGRYAAKVETGRQLAQLAGARATPTFVIGKTIQGGNVSGERLIGAKPFKAFAKRLNTLLAP